MVSANHYWYCWQQETIDLDKNDKEASLSPISDGWTDDMQFFCLFYSISAISGRWKVDNERPCAMELRLRSGRSHLERDLLEQETIDLDKNDKEASLSPISDGWTDDMQFFCLFYSISAISGRWKVDNERPCAMELRLRSGRSHLERRSNSVR